MQEQQKPNHRTLEKPTNQPTHPSKKTTTKKTHPKISQQDIQDYFHWNQFLNFTRITPSRQIKVQTYGYVKSQKASQRK